MKNNKKTLIILIVATVLLLLVLSLMIILLRNQEDASAPAQILSHDVLSADVAQVEALFVRNDSGENYCIELNGTYDGTLEGVDPEMELDAMALSLFVSKYCAIRSNHEPIMLEEKEALAIYGLDAPAGYVVIKKKDGNLTKVLIGDQTVKKNGYYLYVEGSNEVYVVENAYRDYLHYHREDFIDKQLISINQEKEFSITQLTIQNRERPYSGITVRMRFGEYEDNSIYVYEVVEPEYHSADDNKIYENVFSYLNPLKGVEVYSLDVSQENLEKLDLAEPQYILNFISGGIQREFHFSQLASGTVVGRKANGKVILEMDPTILHMLNIQVADVSNAYVLLQSIAEVEHYVVDIKGKSYDFTLSSEGNDLSTVWYEGQELDVEEFRKLYSLGLDIKIAGDMQKEEEKGEKLLTITYLCADGTEHNVDYYVFDGRYCYVTLDGSGRFLVKLSDIEAFGQYLNTLTAMQIT